MNQEMISPGVTKAVFWPIDFDRHSTDGDELCTAALQSRNKHNSIFRLPNDEIHSPHSVARANPIQDEDMREAEDCTDRVISPYPYSPSPEELEDRNHTMLSVNIRESVFGECHDQEKKTLGEGENAVDFSLYFENVRGGVEDVASDIDDDVSFISYDEESLAESDGFRLEPISTSIWDTVLSLAPPRQTNDSKQVLMSRDSPAQVSIGSDNGQGRSPSPLTLRK